MVYYGAGRSVSTAKIRCECLEEYNSKEFKKIFKELLAQNPDRFVIEISVSNGE